MHIFIWLNKKNAIYICAKSANLFINLKIYNFYKNEEFKKQIYDFVYCSIYNLRIYEKVVLLSQVKINSLKNCFVLF